MTVRTPRALRSLALALALFAPALPAPARAAGVSVHARVLLGMKHDPVPGQPVSAHVVRGNEELPGATRTTGADGAVRFDGLPRGADLEYYVSTEFKGAFYTEGPLTLGPDGTTHQDLVVYDTGKEIDKVQVVNHHIIIERQPDGLHVNEILIIENSAETAYLGIGANHAENAGMRLGLPSSIKGFEPGVGGDEGTLVVQGRELMSLRPIPPGQRPLSFTYRVPLSGRVDLSHRFYFPTRSFVVMIDDPGVKLRSKALTYAGSREQGGKRYEMYTGSNLDIGSEVEIRVAGAGFWSNPAVYPWIAAPFVIAAVLVFARRMAPRRARIAPAAARARPAPPSTGPSPAAPPAGEDGGDLAQSYAYLIAALDEGRAKGDVSADSHALLRGNLKRRLELILSDRPTASRR